MVTITPEARAEAERRAVEFIARELEREKQAESQFAAASRRLPPKVPRKD